MLPGDAEHALLGLLGGPGEQNLRGVDVAVSDRALTVPRLRPNVRVRVPSGGLMREGGVSQVVPGRERLRDPRGLERLARESLPPRLLGRNERVRRIHLRFGGDARLTQMRSELLTEPLCGFL